MDLMLQQPDDCQQQPQFLVSHISIPHGPFGPGPLIWPMGASYGHVHFVPAKGNMNCGGTTEHFGLGPGLAHLRLAGLALAWAIPVRNP